MRLVGAGFLVVGVAAASCGTASDGDSIKHAALGAGVVAQVGRDSISARFVAEVASQHQLAPNQALEHVLGAALLAEGARSQFAGTGLVSVAERSALSRVLLEQLHQQAAQAGPPTNAEIDALLHERWMDLDRPVSVQTIHAVVLVQHPEQEASAHAAAERIFQATQGASTAETFFQAAQKVDVAPLEKRVEVLPHMTEDGRAVYLDPLDHRRERPARFDKRFAHAAHAILVEDTRSPVIKSDFGYHVIFLVERVDGVHYGHSELVKMLENDVFDRRAATQVTSLVQQLQKGARVEIARNMAELTEQLAAHP